MCIYAAPRVACIYACWHSVTVHTHLLVHQKALFEQPPEGCHLQLLQQQVRATLDEAQLRNARGKSIKHLQALA